MDSSIDNSVDWFTGEKVANFTFSQKKMVNKLKKLAEDFPEDVKIEVVNKDGSIFGHIPVSWIKISAPRKGREFTEEERNAAAERLRIARENRKNEKI